VLDTPTTINNSTLIQLTNIYQGILNKYVPRILAALSKYSFYRFVLISLGFNNKILLALLVLLI